MNWAKNGSAGSPAHAEIPSCQELGLCEELGGPMQWKVVSARETRQGQSPHKARPGQAAPCRPQYRELLVLNAAEGKGHYLIYFFKGPF